MIGLDEQAKFWPTAAQDNALSLERVHGIACGGKGFRVRDMSSKVVWPSIGGVRMASHFLGIATSRPPAVVEVPVPVPVPRPFRGALLEGLIPGPELNNAKWLCRCGPTQLA